MRRASRERRVLIDVFAGSVRGIAVETWSALLGESCWCDARSEPRNRGVGDVLLSPDTVLTKICIVSSESDVEELMLEMLEERRMVAVAGVVESKTRAAVMGGW